jgi:tetratricopeptide (TPR) repeat protein
MARAAAKRNRGAGKAAGSLTAQEKRPRKKTTEKTLEDELFFSRLRGHAKWAFALLAVVFAGSFVFLGVGSGNAGLGDVFSNVFSGGSAPSIEELQQDVAEHPRDKRKLTDLTQALQRDGRTQEAATAYRTYLSSHPNDENILAALALVLQSQAAAAYDELTIAARDVSLAEPGAQFRPGTGALGEALGSFTDPLGQAASTEAQTRYQAALTKFQSANQDALDVYKQLSSLSPEDSSALIRWAQAAESAGEPAQALKVYRILVKRFPTDPLVVDARQKIKDLQKQVAQQQAQQAVQEATAGSQG